jgi:putative transposase
MKNSSDTHHRHSLRLKYFDYSLPGAYFVTISTYQKADLLGVITGQIMTPNQFGKIIHSVWLNIPSHYPDVHLDSFVIMPNHVHGLLWIGERAGFKPAPTKKYSLSEIVRSFKAFSTREINKIRETSGSPVWQRNYYEHIVRGDKELNTIREYIEANVLNWPLDNEK